MSDIVDRLRKDAANLENGPYTSIKEARDVMLAAAAEIEALRKNSFALSREAYLKFLEMCDNPPPPSEELRKLMKS